MALVGTTIPPTPLPSWDYRTGYPEYSINMSSERHAQETVHKQISSALYGVPATWRPLIPLGCPKRLIPF